MSSSWRGLQGDFRKAAFQIAANAVFLDPLMDDFMAAPAELPEHVGDALAVLLADSGQAVDAVDELPAIPAGSPPAHPVRFHHRHGIAPFRQGQSGGNSGEPGADHADIRHLGALQGRIVGGFVDRGGVVGVRVLLFLAAGFHRAFRAGFPLMNRMAPRQSAASAGRARGIPAKRRAPKRAAARRRRAPKRCRTPPATGPPQPAPRQWQVLPTQAFCRPAANSAPGSCSLSSSLRQSLTFISMAANPPIQTSSSHKYSQWDREAQ